MRANHCFRQPVTTSCHRPYRAIRSNFGFTLTELLVVIVIIALLSGITTMVVRKALVTTHNSLVLAQMTQLSSALDQYKAKYGEYPPDFSDTDAVMRHVRKRWPRYGVTDITQFQNHIMWGSQLSAQIDEDPIHASFNFGFDNTKNYWDFSNGYNFANVSPSPCCHIAPLVFWLGGLPGSTGQPIGFFKAPNAPLGFDSSVITLTGTGTGSAIAEWTNINLQTNKIQREDSFFDFSQVSIVTNGNVPGMMIRGLPLVYFRATSQIYSQNAGTTINAGTYACPWNVASSKYYAFDRNTSDLGVATPYRHAIPGKWYEEDRFQLVYPGADKCFGNPVVDIPNIKYDVATTLPTTPVAWQAFIFPDRSADGQINLSLEDTDNVANFLKNGSTIESEY